MEIAKKRSFLAKSADTKHPYLENADGNLVFVDENGYRGNQHKYEFIQKCWLRPDNWSSRSSYDPAFWGFYSPSNVSGHTRFYLERNDTSNTSVQFASGSQCPGVETTQFGNLFSTAPIETTVHIMINATTGKSQLYIDGILVSDLTSTLGDFGSFNRKIGILSTVKYSSSSASSNHTYTPSMPTSRLYGYQAFIDDVQTLDLIPYLDGTSTVLKDTLTGNIIRPTQGTANYVEDDKYSA